MSDLNNDEIQALAKAVGLTLREPELTQVAHSLNAMLAEMAAIDASAIDPSGSDASGSGVSGLGAAGFSMEEYVAVVQPADLEDAE